MQTPVGQAIRKARAEKGLTLRQLEVLSGVNFKAIHKIERGYTINPRDTTLGALAPHLDIDLAELLSLSMPERAAS